MPRLKEFLSILLTFSLTVLAWVFFRAENISQAFIIIDRIFSISFFLVPENIIIYRSTFTMIFFFLTLEWIGRKNKYAIQYVFSIKSILIRFLFYYLLIFLIFWFSGKDQQFIYFQF